METWQCLPAPRPTRSTGARDWALKTVRCLHCLEETSRFRILLDLSKEVLLLPLIEGPDAAEYL